MFRLTTQATFSFNIRGLDEFDISLYQEYMDGETILVDDMDNGLRMRIERVQHRGYGGWADRTKCDLHVKVGPRC